ncbi:MAG: nucleotidyltransferase family protein [Candidatus Omnitrophica bacterium]|nr:nucleotidyltransferase family protein [Candidatus Omnitrophota bacterium]
MHTIRDFLISPEFTVKQALKKIDEAGRRIIFVVDKKGVILGVVTDGNMRRWILEGRSLNKKVTKVMNSEPIVLKEGYLREDAKAIMLSEEIECIPIVDDKRKVISAAWWVDLFQEEFKPQKKIDTPVVVMAGGEGTRLLPFTHVLPKPLIPVGEKPIIEMIIDKFSQYGCEDFYFSLNYKSNIIKAYFNDFEHKYRISYIQEERPLGTAGSLHLLKKKIRGTFFVVNCDTLIEADYTDILRFHKDKKNKITLVGAMKHYTIPYGVCKLGRSGSLVAIEEKPEHDFLAITGLYLLEPQVLRQIPANKCYHLTDLINSCLKKGCRVGVYPISEKSWLDMGELQELQKTLKKFEMK